MTEPTDAAPAEALPSPVVKRRVRSRLSLVWVVPILALVIGGALLARTLLQSGPRIEIDFRTAEGLEPGKTEVRYKEVVIGRVESVTLRDDRKRVIATVKLIRSAAGVAVDDTSFWVVRPRVGAGGISGLGTLFSGAYIGVDAGASTTSRSEYIGLESPPFMLRREAGGSFVLRAADLGSLDVGSPVLYRRTRVGRVVGYTLDPALDDLTVKIFIEAPYQSLVSAQTRFWNDSGIDLTVGANGVTLNTQTLSSVLAGAVAFEQLPDALKLPPAVDGSHFYLYNDRKSALAPADGLPIPVRMVFDQSMRGLAAGAPIDFLGIEIGSVRAVSLQYDGQRQRFPVQVMAEIYPLRLGAVRTAFAKRGDEESLADVALLQRLVDGGLRAQARTGNLLTGQLFVALDFDPKAKGKRAPLKVTDGAINLPTVAGTLSELQPQVADIVQKLSKVPFDDIGRNLASTLRQADASLTQLTPEVQKAMAEVQRTLSVAQASLAQLTPEAQKALTEVQRTLSTAQGSLERLDRNLIDPGGPMNRNLDQTLVEFQRAAQSLRVLSDFLQRHPEALLRGNPADRALPSTSK